MLHGSHGGARYNSDYAMLARVCVDVTSAERSASEVSIAKSSSSRWPLSLYAATTERTNPRREKQDCFLHRHTEFLLAASRLVRSPQKPWRAPFLDPSDSESDLLLVSCSASCALSSFSLAPSKPIICYTRSKARTGS
jgi:hypothetical protein